MPQNGYEIQQLTAATSRTRGGGVCVGEGEGDRIGLTIPILRWEEKRPRMGRSAGAASFLALGGIVGGRRSAAMRPEEPGMARVFWWEAEGRLLRLPIEWGR